MKASETLLLYLLASFMSGFVIILCTLPAMVSVGFNQGVILSVGFAIFISFVYATINLTLFISQVRVITKNLSLKAQVNLMVIPSILITLLITATSYKKASMDFYLFCLSGICNMVVLLLGSYFIFRKHKAKITP